MKKILSLILVCTVGIVFSSVSFANEKSDNAGPPVTVMPSQINNDQVIVLNEVFTMDEQSPIVSLFSIQDQTTTLFAKEINYVISNTAVNDVGKLNTNYNNISNKQIAGVIKDLKNYNKYSKNRTTFKAKYATPYIVRV